MQTFKVQRCDHVDGPAAPVGTGDFRTLGFRAPGPVILLLQEGTGWIVDQDGSRQNLDAKSVVIYTTNDWIEYGSDSNRAFKIETYWAADLTEEAWTAMLAGAFGSDEHP